MSLSQLIYVSRPLGYDPQQLDDILTVSRARNAAAGITGLLLSRWDLFLHILEGPRDAVGDTFTRIRRDLRHVEVTLLHLGCAEARLFADWAMRGDPLPDWLWSRADVLAGKPREASPEEALTIFARIAGEAPTG